MSDGDVHMEFVPGGTLLQDVEVIRDAMRREGGFVAGQIDGLLTKIIERELRRVLNNGSAKPNPASTNPKARPAQTVRSQP